MTITRILKVKPLPSTNFFLPKNVILINYHFRTHQLMSLKSKAKQSHILLSAPSIKGNEWKYVKECLDTEWVSSAGSYVDLFEEKIAEYTGAKHAIACVNGTAALQVSLRLAGVRPGDEVIVPSLTFIAPVNALRYQNATPVFMDADNYFNLDASKAIEFIENETEFKNGSTFNRRTRRRISAVVPVHIFGNAVWMDELSDVCSDRNIVLVEDASESLGTRYRKGRFSGRHAGTIGALGCLSFNGNKIITTGGGGMILTDDPDLAERAKYLTTQAKDDPVRYVHNHVGYNFRLTNLQAAIGVAQLEQLPDFLDRKAETYLSYLRDVNQIAGLRIIPVPPYADNNHWMNVVQIDPGVYGRDRDALMMILQKSSIQSRPVWYPNHLQRPYCDCQTYKIERTEKLVETSLCLPSSSHLDEEETKRVVTALHG